MKLQKTTWVLLIIALLLGGFVYFYEIVGGPQREAVKEAEKQLFSFEEDEIEQVNIYIGEESLKFKRVSEPEPGWRMIEPKQVPASDPSVSFLLNLLVEGKSDRIIPDVSPESLKEYGLDEPQAVITVRLKNDQTHEILLGQPDFNQSFLYAKVDPFSDKSQQFDVFLVPIDFEYAVNRPLSEWEQSKENTSEESESSDTENGDSASELKSDTEEKEPSQPQDKPSSNNSDADTEESTPAKESTAEEQKPPASPSPKTTSSSEDKKQPTEEADSPREETKPKNVPNESESEDIPSE